MRVAGPFEYFGCVLQRADARLEVVRVAGDVGIEHAQVAGGDAVGRMRHALRFICKRARMVGLHFDPCLNCIEHLQLGAQFVVAI